MVVCKPFYEKFFKVNENALVNKGKTPCGNSHGA
jgi:hypothetical protein